MQSRPGSRTMLVMSSSSPCFHCGAPREAGLAVCRYCRTPLIENVAANAVPCPQCGLLHEKAAQKCASCATWLVVQCVFCSTLSPHNDASCEKCGEAFAGAVERFQARQQEQVMKQRLDMVSSVGGVAAGLLGAVASSGVLSSNDSCDHHDERRRRRHRPRHQEQSSEGGGIFDALFKDTDPSDDGS